MGMNVKRPGLLTTVQDLGRFGFQQYGVIVSGAMDWFAHRLANLLVGNREGEAALEITLIGPELFFEEDKLIALCGGNLTPTIDGQPVPQWRPIYIKKGSLLKFGMPFSGCRTYLAVAGGFDIPEVMGSRSTYLRAGIGGFAGRALKAGDVLNTHSPSDIGVRITRGISHESLDEPFQAANWFADSAMFPDYSASPILRVLPGNQIEDFDAMSKERFFSSSFQVTPQSDRMGYRLAGPVLTLAEPREMLSEAVAAGTIQVPPDGNPIVLLADRQTTGGYPKIAQIITADLPVIAQIKAGEQIQFRAVSLEEAQQLSIEQERNIEQLKQSIELKAK